MTASSEAQSPGTVLLDRFSSVGYFAYHIYAETRFPELEEFSANGTYPEPEYDWQESYIDGNVRIVLWKVVERLIAENVFAPLRLASPFRIGYQFHDDGHFIVLRILNWPQI